MTQSSEDKSIVDSAERMSAEAEATKRAVATTRHNALTILGAILAAGYVITQLISGVTQCSVANSSERVQAKELYFKQLSECEARVGVGQCWELQYQHCLDERRGASCKDLVPVSDEVRRETIYYDQYNACKQQEKWPYECWKLQYQHCIDQGRSQESCEVIADHKGIKK